MDSLKQWFIHPLKNQFADFEGRSTVQQYWMFTLWYFIFSILLELIDQDLVSSFFALVLLIPGLAIGARRLHDSGKSGWWQLLWFIPIIGWIILIVFLVTKSETGANSYGPDPKDAFTPASVSVPPVVPTPPSVAPTPSAVSEGDNVGTNFK